MVTGLCRAFHCRVIAINITPTPKFCGDLSFVKFNENSRHSHIHQWNFVRLTFLRLLYHVETENTLKPFALVGVNKSALALGLYVRTPPWRDKEFGTFFHIKYVNIIYVNCTILITVVRT